MNKWASLLLVSFLIVTGGCVRKSILDDINTITGLGYDYVAQNKIKGTGLVPVYGKGKISNATYTATSTTSKDMIEELQHESSNPLAKGSLEVALYGERLAKKGLIEIMDTLRRDPRIGERVYLAVVKGTAHELLEGNYGKLGNGIYLSDLIQQNIEQRDIPKTNLHKFLYDYYSDGKDPFLPYMERKGNKVKILGIALFDNDRMVDYIRQNEMFYFKILVDRYTEGTHTIRIGRNEYAAIKSIVTDRNFSISGPKEHPNITVRISIKGVLHEYSRGRYSKTTKQRIEQAFQKELVKKSSKIIRELQSYHIDPIGFGDETKSRYRHFSYKNFYKNYPSLHIDVKANVTIIDSGVVE
ncbi:Ger(x)C family spore germination protein [Anoxybacteroides tepidamans]|uniref:Ger(x)C family spore germination protein n=1 Tax=Anoxybacteroides tepidamans TaxID=265948 RepID=UPI0004849ED8|nr:Ger(x)C family spore germination protein [Anoxybacillus tepidamans]